MDHIAQFWVLKHGFCLKSIEETDTTLDAFIYEIIYVIIVHIEFVNRMHSETIVAHANILKPTCGPANLDRKISHFSRVEQMYLSIFLVLFRIASLIVMVEAMIHAFLLAAWTVRYMYTHEFL